MRRECDGKKVKLFAIDVQKAKAWSLSVVLAKKNSGSGSLPVSSDSVLAPCHVQIELIAQSRFLFSFCLLQIYSGAFLTRSLRS